MTDQLYCPECADKWNGAYNSDHRCVTCGSPLKVEKVMDRLMALEEERDALAAHLEAGREAVEHARQWVPQHVWARLWLWKEDAPTTSLARLKAQAKAEALERFANDWPWGEFRPDPKDIRQYAKHVSRQAKGNTE